MTIFSDLANEYQLLDYTPSHSQLLIRSMRNLNRDYNIDIIVKSVFAILMPTEISGIEISIAETNDTKYLIDNFGFSDQFGYYGYEIFSIKDSKGNIYYLNAGSFGVYHTKLDILETSIGRYDYGPIEGENVLWYNNQGLKVYPNNIVT